MKIVYRAVEESPSDGDIHVPDDRISKCNFEVTRIYDGPIVSFLLRDRCAAIIPVESIPPPDASLMSSCSEKRTCAAYSGLTFRTYKWLIFRWTRMRRISNVIHLSATSPRFQSLAGSIINVSGLDFE